MHTIIRNIIEKILNRLKIMYTYINMIVKCKLYS